MEEKWIKLIEEYYADGVSLAGITSLFYHKGFKGCIYLELRKMIFKECQRIESKKPKK